MSTSGPFEELAATFMAPARSGVYLAKNELLVLARLSEASLRYSERKRMFTDILKSAQDADQLVALLDRLIAFCRENVAEYEAFATAYPAAVVTWRPWIDRAKKMALLLEQTQEEIRL